jgi:predicted phage baseplate assembly protein
MVRASQLPRIREITMGVSLNRSGLVIDRAFTNQLPLDLSRDFLIFGEKPRFTDVFNLANREAFSQSDAVINLQVELTAADTGIPPPKPSANLKLQWEFWDGKAWLAIGTTTPAIIPESPDAPTIPAIAQAAGTNRFADETEALTKTGAIHFTFPAPPAATTVNGVKSFWLRVRIVSGNYGEEARYEPDTTDTTPPRPEYRLIPATFAPPSISSITVDYELTRQGEAPEVILTQNDFAYTNVTHPVNQANQSFSPFQATQDTHPTLYLGFTLPAGREDFPNRNLSLFNCSAEPTDAQGPVPLALGGNEDNPRLSWEYFNGQTWHTLIVLDETDALRRSGLLEVLPPADFASSTEFGLRRYWLRVRWVSGAYRVEPRLQRVLLNTTLATQTRTLGNEILGSGNGTAGQIFRTVQAPVLPGQQLEVREPELPAAEEQEALRQAPGEAGIASVLDAAGRPREVWIRWQEVPDFYGSGPHDRHYVLDHLNGEVRFGDGLHGRIPPVDTGNIRMTRYQIGGGATGNRPANTVVQLLTTVPFVDSVINPEPATGGADMETLEALRERGPTLLRHRHRVVTLEDYEDLAKMASPAVARAKCVPLRDLVADPLGQFSRPGAVSVIVVPQATAARPLPSRELLRRVQDYLEANVLPTATIAVVGPLYITVSVSVELTLVALQGASAVEQAVQQALARFLHPLTGGPQGTGWAFGRQPQKSDFYALLEAIAGVDYVRTLEVAVSEDLPGSEATGRFLINSGRHRIDLVFEG